MIAFRIAFRIVSWYIVLRDSDDSCLAPDVGDAQWHDIPREKYFFCQSRAVSPVLEINSGAILSRPCALPVFISLTAA